MKRLTLPLALIACLGSVGARADPISVPALGRSAVTGITLPGTRYGGSFSMAEIKSGWNNNKSPLGDGVDLSTDFMAPATWDFAVGQMLNLPTPGGRPYVARDTGALPASLPSLHAGFLLDARIKNDGWAWAWAWGNHGVKHGDDPIWLDDSPGNTNGEDLMVLHEVTEPASLLLLGTGLIGLAAAARRHRTRT